MDKIREAAYVYAAFNASQHSGRAQPGAIIGRIMGEFPEARGNAKEVQKLIAEIVAEVNGWTPERQLEHARTKASLFEARKPEEKKTLPSLKNVDKWPKVKTRFAPNPDGPLHMGSAEPITFCDEYAKMYSGDMILRFEDTSADVKPPIPEMYDEIKRDLQWLGVKIAETYIQSDRLPIYYEHAEKILGKGQAYVCTCDPDEYKKLYMAKQPCPCREQPVEEQLKRWRMMLDGTYKRGQAVVRVKTDITHPNPAVRDWPALRIATRSHPRVGKKHRVWPLYNFSCAVDDHLMGVSHIIRGKEHEINGVRQKWMYDHLGWQYPEVINIARLRIEAGVLSKSKIRAGVENGTYSGWDDARLGTLQALRRRGIQAEAIREIMLQIPPRPVNATISWGNVAAANRKIVEPRANRFFFVRDPVTVNVKGVNELHEAKLPLHPDHPERGHREYTVKPATTVSFLMPRKDLADAEGKLVRLMGLMNIEVVKVGQKAEAKYHSRDHGKARGLGAPFIHWLQPEEATPARVMMPDATFAEGAVEKKALALNVDEVLQFERFGFARVDSSNPPVFYYSHE